MNTTETKAAAEIMRRAAEGEPLQYRSKTDPEERWIDCRLSPTTGELSVWDFYENLYRIKPTEPETKPPTHEEEIAELKRRLEAQQDEQASVEAERNALYDLKRENQQLIESLNRSVDQQAEAIRIHTATIAELTRQRDEAINERDDARIIQRNLSDLRDKAVREAASFQAVAQNNAAELQKARADLQSIRQVAREGRLSDVQRWLKRWAESTGKPSAAPETPVERAEAPKEGSPGGINMRLILRPCRCKYLPDQTATGWFHGIYPAPTGPVAIFEMPGADGESYLCQSDPAGIEFLDRPRQREQGGSET